MADLLNALQWRYATKKFDTTKKVSSEDIKTLINVARLAPSSFGLEPWKIVDVRNPDMRRQIQKAAYGQPQIVEADHIFVLCRPNKMDETNINGYISLSASITGQNVEDLESLKKMLLNYISTKTEEQLAYWMEKQVYIALGFLLEAAALMKIDACPMEGFDRAQFDEILKLPQKGFRSVVLFAVGYRSVDDPMISRKKVRMSADDILMIA